MDSPSSEHKVEFDFDLELHSDGTAKKKHHDEKQRESMKSTHEQVRINTWNLLSTELSRHHHHCFCKENDLKTENRWLCIQRTLEFEIACNAIFCLQEVNVEWETLLIPFLNLHGYCYYSKTYGGSLGVMIAWPKMFQLTRIRCVPLRNEIRKLYLSEWKLNSKEKDNSLLPDHSPITTTRFDRGCLCFLYVLQWIYRIVYQLIVVVLLQHCLLEGIVCNLILSFFIWVFNTMDKELCSSCRCSYSKKSSHDKHKPSVVVRAIKRISQILITFRKKLEVYYRSPIEHAMDRPNFLIYIQLNLPSHTQQEEPTNRNVSYGNMVRLQGLFPRYQVPQLIHHSNSSISYHSQQHGSGDVRNEIAVATYHMPCAFMDLELMQIHLTTILELVQEWSKVKHLPLILAGDFNLTSDSNSILKPTIRKYGLRSIYEAVHNCEPRYTCHSRTADSKKLFSSTIDYVLVSDHWKTIKHLRDIPSVCDVPSLPNHVNPSDHIMIGGTLGF